MPSHESVISKYGAKALDVALAHAASGFAEPFFSASRTISV
jgi:hypothetical protein